MFNVNKEQLEKLLRLSGGLIAAIDGIWFLAVEEAFGNEKAVELDRWVWERYMHVLVKRIKNIFGISAEGMNGIKEIIENDPLFLINDYEFPEFSEKKMVLRINRCPVLEAMERQGRKRFVCESTTGLYFKNLAKEIDANIVVHPLKLPPRESPEDISCEWLFKLQD